MNIIDEIDTSFLRLGPQFGLILLLLGGIWGCENAPVDKEYTQSRDFQSFQQKQKREYAAQVESRKSLKKFLSAYMQCDKGRKWDLPVQIDYNLLQKFGKRCTLLSDSFNTDFTSESIGYSRINDVTIRWLLLKREGAYENWEFLAVTYRDSALVSFQSLGTFRKNLSQDISTTISVSRKEDFVYISSIMNRGFIYPVRYENVVEREYKIDSLGRISAQAELIRSYNGPADYLKSYYRCEVGRELELPILVDESAIRKNGAPCTAFNENMDSNYRFQSIGYVRHNDFQIRIIEMKEEFEPGDRYLWLAVFGDDSLHDHTTIGKFGTYADKQINTTAELTRDSDFVYIRSTINHSITYPINHTNTEHLSLRVGNNGQIVRNNMESNNKNPE